MTRYPIALRNGEPAWKNAPRRLLASQIDKPFQWEEPRRGFLARVVERLAG